MKSVRPVWDWKISVGGFRIYWPVLRRRKTLSKTVSLIFTIIDSSSQLFRFCWTFWSNTRYRDAGGFLWRFLCTKWCGDNPDIRSSRDRSEEALCENYQSSVRQVRGIRAAAPRDLAAVRQPENRAGPSGEETLLSRDQWGRGRGRRRLQGAEENCHSRPECEQRPTEQGQSAVQSDLQLSQLSLLRPLCHPGSRGHPGALQQEVQQSGGGATYRYQAGTEDGTAEYCRAL